MRRWGVVGRRGDARTALVDVDAAHPPRLQSIWRTVAGVGLVPRLVEYRRTARGWHVAVSLNRALTCGELVALQLLLGSDRKRERYNLARVICGAPPAEFNLLFSHKVE